MNVEENSVYSFKLNSGEEIIGKVIGVNETIYTLTSPLSTGMTQQGMQLMPAMFTIELDAEVTVSKSSVAMIAIPRQDVADAYRESTTGIKVPEKQIILG